MESLLAKEKTKQAMLVGAAILPVLGQATSTCLDAHNFANAQYTVEVEFGTPSQKLKMIPDSGSSDLVVPSAKCTADDGCGGALHRPLLTRATK